MRIVLSLLCLAPILTSSTVQDTERDLRSKDPALREAAVRALSAQGAERVERKLLTALKDSDWLVLLAAIDGLAAHGTRDALGPLLDLATEGPCRIVRERAATALAQRLPNEASEKLHDDLRGKNGPVVLAALTAVASAGARPASTERLGRWLTDDSTDVRSAAAAARIACADPAQRGAVLGELFAERDLAQKAAALNVLAALAEPRDLPSLLAVLQHAKLEPVLERRAEAAAVAAVRAAGDGAQRAAALEQHLAPLLRSAVGAAESAARLARIVTGLGSALPPADAHVWLAKLVAHEDAAPRAAAAKALGELGGDAAPELVVARLKAESSGRVRTQLVHAALALGLTRGDKANEPAVTELVGLLLRDSEAQVREAAAIALGQDGAGNVACEALVKATEDRQWEVAVSATVALGKTRTDAAVTRLTALCKHDDWRMRGAAAMGLFHVARADSVAPLLALLTDSNTAVAATAHQALGVHAGREGEAVKPKEWTAWWQDNLQKVRFATPDEERARRDKYGYSVPDREIFRGLDVMVIPGRGDHLEGVLGRLEIQFRTIQAGQLGDQGVHPFGILVAGCTGEVEARDLDVIRWFVRTGGALMTSCWALTHTVDASFPGLVTKFPSPGEVLDRVRAWPVAPGSPYLTGVFDGGVEPIYELQGAHLIQVLDPERVQVLVDSPEAALRHGSGDLTAWFRAGHGVVLDSVNHFDLQGLELATHLKTPEELQGYAVDHMGLSLERLREVADEKWWKSRSKAAKEIDDLSAFRILTNFVREKRINGT